MPPSEVNRKVWGLPTLGLLTSDVRCLIGFYPVGLSVSSMVWSVIAELSFIPITPRKGTLAWADVVWADSPDRWSGSLGKARPPVGPTPEMNPMSGCSFCALCVYGGVRRPRPTTNPIDKKEGALFKGHPLGSNEISRSIRTCSCHPRRRRCWYRHPQPRCP